MVYGVPGAEVFVLREPGHHSALDPVYASNPSDNVFARSVGLLAVRGTL